MDNPRPQFQPPKLPWYAWPVLPFVFVGALALFVVLFLLMLLLVVLVGIPMYLILPRKWRPAGPNPQGTPGWQRWTAHGQRSGWLGNFQWTVQSEGPWEGKQPDSGKEIAVTVVNPDAKALPSKPLQ